MSDNRKKNDEEKKGISRRKFIAGTAAGAAVLAAGAGIAKALPGVSAAGSVTPAAASSAPLSLQPSGQSFNIPTSWDETVDVLIVGAAGAGMAAAIEAAEAGANTLIIEKMDHWGGLFMAAGGSCTIGGNNHIQQRDGITGDSLELWYNCEMLGADYRGNPELVQTYVQNGDSFLYFMESLGAVWAPITQGVYPTTLPNGQPSPKRGMSLAASSNYPSTTGFDWTYLLNQKLTQLNVLIMLNTALTGLYRQPNGPVVGASAQTQTGTLNIQALRGVIIATGGAADNPHLMHAYDPRYDVDMDHDGSQPPGTPDFVQNTGDGHLAAMAVGAGLTDMSYPIYTEIHYGTHLYFVWPTQSPRNYLSDFNAAGQIATSTGLSTPNFKYAICVKGDGTRFVNEMSESTSISTFVGLDPYSPFPYQDGGEWPEHQFLRAWLNLPDRPRNCWAIVDSVGAKASLWDTAAMQNPNPLVSPSLYPDAVTIANDIPTLAAQMGVSASGLVTTVNNYNSYVDSGVDPDFGKSSPQYKINTPPYYAAKMIPIRHTQRNGIRINSNAQVIDQMASQWQMIQASTQVSPISINQEPVIPHLYAAGEVAANFGWRRFHNSLGAYIIWGRIAGQQAAAEEPISS